MSRLANTIRMDHLAVLHPQAQVRLFADNTCTAPID
jgi:hypothetical protein